MPLFYWNKFIVWFSEDMLIQCHMPKKKNEYKFDWIDFCMLEETFFLINLKTKIVQTKCFTQFTLQDTIINRFIPLWTEPTFCWTHQQLIDILTIVFVVISDYHLILLINERAINLCKLFWPKQYVKKGYEIKSIHLNVNLFRMLWFR